MTFRESVPYIEKKCIRDSAENIIEDMMNQLNIDDWDAEIPKQYYKKHLYGNVSISPKLLKI